MKLRGRGEKDSRGKEEALEGRQIRFDVLFDCHIGKALVCRDDGRPS